MEIFKKIFEYFTICYKSLRFNMSAVKKSDFILTFESLEYVRSRLIMTGRNSNEFELNKLWLP